MNFPPAYFITWGTFGTRLHGCDRPFVDREHNEYGTPFPPTDPVREHFVRERLSQEPVRLTNEQRREVESALLAFTAKYYWPVHAIAVQSDHVHVVITADRAGDPLREALKAAASRTLNATYGKSRWWAEGGSDKHLYEPEYFANSVAYVQRQRDW